MCLLYVVISFFMDESGLIRFISFFFFKCYNINVILDWVLYNWENYPILRLSLHNLGDINSTLRLAITRRCYAQKWCCFVFSALDPLSWGFNMNKSDSVVVMSCCVDILAMMVLMCFVVFLISWRWWCRVTERHLGDRNGEWADGLKHMLKHVETIIHHPGDFF